MGAKAAKPVTEEYIDGQELQDASMAPLTGTEKSLLSRSGKSCVWSDAGEYSYRLRQLYIINHAVTVLARETWKESGMIEYNIVHQKVLNVLDAEEQPLVDHPWALVSEDPTFTSIELSYNRFKEMKSG